MTFDEFCDAARFGKSLPMDRLETGGYREYESRVTFSTKIGVRLCDTRDETYMAGVEKQAKRELWDWLRRELLDG